MERESLVPLKYNSLPAAVVPVTAIITTYNRATLLPRAIDSVLHQTYQAFELIIVDDCSTDDTRSVVERYLASDALGRIRYIRNQRNCDAQESRNIAIDAARGDFIACLDDDDIWLPDKLQLQLPLAKRFAVVGCRHAFDHIPERPALRLSGSVPYRHKTLEEFFRSNEGFSPTKIMTRRSYLQAIGGYDKTLPGPEGIDVFARLVSRFGKAVYIDRVLVVHFTDHRMERITTSERMLRGCINEFEKNKHLRSPAAQRYRLCQIDLMRVGREASLAGKVRFLWSAAGRFDWQYASDYIRLFRSRLVLPFPPLSWLHRLYRRYKYR